MSIRPGRANAFSLMELLVCVAIVGILVTLAFPWAKSAGDMAQLNRCVANLRQIGAAAALYAGENNGKLPPFPSVTDDYWSAYTIWNNPSGVKQWMYMGKLFEGGYLTDPRVFYCPTALKGMFDYQSQWAASVQGANVLKGFRIGYLQRVVDTGEHPGVVPLTDGKSHILMTDNFKAADYSQHPYIPNPTHSQRWVNVLYSDGHVSTDRSGNRWSHTLTSSLYDDWEKNP